MASLTYWERGRRTYRERGRRTPQTYRERGRRTSLTFLERGRRTCRVRGRRTPLISRERDRRTSLTLPERSRRAWGRSAGVGVPETRWCPVTAPGTVKVHRDRGARVAAALRGQAAGKEHRSHGRFRVPAPCRPGWPLRARVPRGPPLPVPGPRPFPAHPLRSQRRLRIRRVARVLMPARPAGIRLTSSRPAAVAPAPVLRGTPSPRRPGAGAPGLKGRGSRSLPRSPPLPLP